MTNYEPTAPSRAEVDAFAGLTVLDFGTSWCGWCRAAAPIVEQALEPYRGIRHLRIEDGKGRPLGRSFGVKLWPTLIFLEDGREFARLVRPADRAAIDEALDCADAD